MAEPADELFSDLRPPQVAATPTTDADSLFADLKPGYPNVTGIIPSPGATIMDTVRGAGSGLAKGAIGVAALPGLAEQLGRAGINAVANASGKKDREFVPVVSPETALPNYSSIKERVENNVGKLYEPKTKPGKYAQTIAEFAPGMLIPGGPAQSLVRKAATSVVAPAVASEAAGQATAGTSLEPYARVAGGVVGGGIPNAVGRAISPMRIDPERTRQAGILANEGVGVTAGQVSGSKPLRYAESVAVDTPLAGRRAGQIMDAQAEQFTAATLRRAGIDAPRATPEVLNDAFIRIGRDFDAASMYVNVPLARAANVRVAGVPATLPEPIIRRVNQIADAYERVSQPSLMSPLPRQIANDLENLANQSLNMDGRTYLRWRSELGDAARGAQDSATRNAIYDIQNALDTAAESWLRRGNVPQMSERLRNARREYRNMIVIEKAATSAGENAANGLISPAALRAATVQQNRRAYARGQGEFGELSRAGAALMSPLPNSGTGPRVGVQLLGGAIGGGLGALMGGPGGAAGGALAGHMAPHLGQALMGRTVMNPTVQRYLQNQVAAGLRDLPLGRRIETIPGVVVQGNDR